mgnify:CR=1 FL=1
MDDRLIVTASPHIRDNATTRGLMGNVLIALVPSIVASGLIFGMRAILPRGTFVSKLPMRAHPRRAIGWTTRRAGC